MQRKTLIIGAILAVVGAGITIALWSGSFINPMHSLRAPPAPSYLTIAIDRGSITRVINASGTLNPVNVVQVGTQASGRIVELHADFNSKVAKGQLLAQIDRAAAQADLEASSANLRKLQANLSLYEAELRRTAQLVAQGYVSQSEHDQALERRDGARAALDQQQATIKRLQLNIEYTRIVSPVAGTILSREVAVGQTVQASFSAPVLFRIAQDLRQMQIEASIPEADIGGLKIGQQVEFSVDAFADRRFKGHIRQVRNNYTVQQNVVTYGVIIDANNDDQILRPGMTAYLRIEVDRRDQVLRIPNAALRYATSQLTEVSTRTGASSTRPVYRLASDGSAERLEVSTGLADSAFTELQGTSLREGETLIIGLRPEGGFKGPKIL
jgi:HlyD family secretion protein